jgi:aminopeptidase N
MSHRAHLSALVPHASAPGFARAGIDADYAPDLSWEPVHLGLDLRPDIATRGMSAEMVLTVVCNDPSTRVLDLDAVELSVASVEGLDGEAVEWSTNGDQLRIVWETSARRGEERKVRIRWSVERPVSGLVGPTADWDAVAGPFLATDHETQRARYWLPCIDHPSVRPKLDVAVTVPSEHHALSAGALVDDTDNGDGTHTVRWRLTERCPIYLTCVATGAFSEADGGVHTTADGRTVPVAFFAPLPFTSEDLQRTFGPTREMLDWMTGFLDSTFPYPKYYQFAVPGIGGAMENISLVSWDDAWVLDERAHAEIGWLVDLINLHEMAHTWFGDVVVCRDYSHAWLKESWATYMESVWLEDTVGTDAMHLQLADERRAYFSEADGVYIRPIATRFFDSAWDLYDRHLYPGGAIRLHLLRDELGDDAFWRGVRAYLARYRNGVVESDDFRRELEAASGRSLARFFDDWFRSPGYPRLTATWSYDADQGQGSLSLKRKAWDKDKKVPRFSLPVTVDVLDAGGSWHRKLIRFDKETATVRFKLERDAQQVVVDPESVLPAKITLAMGVGLLKRAVVECPKVRGRLDAATALADKARPQGLDAIAAAYRTEAHWQVRAHFSRCLGSAATHHAAQRLSELLAFETDPRAMQPLLDACGKYRQPSLADAVVDWLDAGERPYRASAAALTALGNQRDPRFEDRLIAATADDGWWGWVARGAVIGLGALRTDGAVMALEALASDPTTKRSVRLQAADNLGKAGRWQSRATRERLVGVLTDLTRSPDHGVRKSAASGLVHLGEPSGAGAIAQLARVGLPVQERARFEKKAQKLRGKDPGGRVGALEKTVEKLTSDLAKLRAKLEATEDGSAQG